MSDSEEEVKDYEGGKRKNGHKANCGCHICMNMKNKKKHGGYEEEATRKKMGYSKKKNGHKPNCKCPICKNMKHMKKGGATDDSDSESDSDSDSDSDTDFEQTAGRKKRKGNNHKLNCKCPICKNMKKKGGDGSEEVAPDADYDNLDNIKDSIKGGRRRTKRRRPSKTNKRKTRRNRKRSHRRR